jgi:LuxR family maltose regulon positive regulatory protein
MIFASEVVTPSPPAGYVERGRLTAWLDAAAAYRVTAVAAPAGWGKTTAVAGWLASRAARRAPGDPSDAYVTLERVEGEPALLGDLLAAACRTLHPAVGMTGDAVRPAGATLDPMDAVAILLTELAAVGAVGCLVLDDCHAVADGRARDALARFVEYAPPDVRLVLLARHEPVPCAARLRARGQLADLREDALRFAPDEAAALVHAGTGRRLGAAQVRVLAERVQGWAAGLRLAQLSLARASSMADVDAVLAGFTGTTRDVADYLAGEVLGRTTPAHRDFLLRVSVLPTLTPDGCRAVTGRADAGATLDELAREGALVSPARDGALRLHPLFRELLRARLQQDPATAADACARAAAWCAARGDVADAAELRLASGDTGAAADAVAAAAPRVLLGSSAARVERWLDALPEATVRARAVLAAMRAWALFVRGRADDAERWLGHAESRTEVGEDDVTRGMVAAVRAYAALRCHDAARTVEAGSHALRLLGTDAPALRAAVLAQLATAHVVTGDSAAAAARLSEAFALSRARSGGDAELDAPELVLPLTYGAWQCWQTGNLREAERLYGAARALALHGDAPLPGAAVAESGLADVAYEHDELERAARHVEQALDLAAREGSTEARVTALFTAARVGLARGDVDGALRAARDAARDGHFLGSLAGYLEALEIECRARAGDVDAAVAWARALPREGGAPDEFAVVRAGRRLAAARVLLGAGHAREVVERLTAPAADDAEEGAPGGAFGVALRAVRASAHMASGDAEAARRDLDAALAAGAQHGRVRSIVDAGPALAPLVLARCRAAAEGVGDHAPAYLHRIRDAYAQQVALDAPASTGATQMRSPTRLTARETQVLRLVAEGLRNRAIAERLGSSPATVKKQLLGIFQKIDVTSRTQAAVRARELGLLP